jgi:energy-coupling factor transporter ATP-binding protein EcfA2
MIKRVSIFNKSGLEEGYLEYVNLRDMAPRDFLIKRLRFEKGTLINICGTGASGKTLLAQYMALCIANNKPLFGAFNIEYGDHSILHIDQEQSKNLTLRRYSRIAKGLNLDNTYGKITRIKLTKFLDDPNYNSKQIEDELVEICSKYSLTILDSLRQSTEGDENSSQISGVVSMLKRVAERANTVFIFIHHKGKGVSAKQSGRGSSAIFDNEDLQIDLDADPNTGTVKVSCAKNRDGVYFKGFSYKVEDEGEIIFNQDCSEKLIFELISDEIPIKYDDLQKNILKNIKENENINSGKLFDLIKGKRVIFDECIDQMVQQNLINKKNKGRTIFFTLGKNALISNIDL